MPDLSDQELFAKIGLSEQKIKETIKNKLVTQNLRTAVLAVCFNNLPLKKNNARVSVPKRQQQQWSFILPSCFKSQSTNCRSHCIGVKIHW